MMCWTLGIAIIKNFMILLEKHHALAKGEGINAFSMNHYITCEKWCIGISMTPLPRVEQDVFLKKQLTQEDSGCQQVVMHMLWKSKKKDMGCWFLWRPSPIIFVGFF
jgi:hypothetical protein